MCVSTLSPPAESSMCDLHSQAASFCFAFHSNNLHMAGVMMLCFFLHEMDRIELMTAQAFSTAFTVLHVTHTQLLICLYPYKHWQTYSKLQEDTDTHNYSSYAHTHTHNKCAFKCRHAHTPPTNACYRFGLIVLTSMCLS